MFNQLSIFHGAASDAEARVYVRAPREGWPADARLSGKVIGPFCEFSQTLPATIQMADCGPGETLLAQSIVPDPCCWTPDLPFLYRAEISLTQGGTVLAKSERQFGIRRLGVHGRNLIYTAKRWVLRGIGIEATDFQSTDIRQLRDLAATFCIQNPDDAVCELASRQGLLLLADLSQGASRNGSELLDELQRLSQWPAVGVAMLPAGTELSPNMNRIVPNLLLAERFAANQPIRPSAWASIAVFEVESVESFAEQSANCRLPIVSLRHVSATESMSELRRECDLFQADLASIGDFAGYVVEAALPSSN